MDLTAFIRNVLTVTQLGVILLGACIALPAIRVRLPEFEPAPTKVTHKKGDKARLYCSVKHLGERTVVWRRLSAKGPLTIGAKTWINDRRISVDHSGLENRWDLLIQDVNLDDAGEYECQISISKKILRHVVDLSVSETSSSPVKRNQEIFISGTHFLNSGDEISLYCNATIDINSRSALVWFKDMEEVDDEDDRISFSQEDSPDRDQVSSHLKIQSAQRDDSGVYTCRLHDDTLMTSAHVSVLTGGGSNNVKRAGSVTLPPESNAVLSAGIQYASTHTVYIALILLVHWMLT